MPGTAHFRSAFSAGENVSDVRAGGTSAAQRGLRGSPRRSSPGHALVTPIAPFRPIGAEVPPSAAVEVLGRWDAERPFTSTRWRHARATHLSGSDSCSFSSSSAGQGWSRNRSAVTSPARCRCARGGPSVRLSGGWGWSGRRRENRVTFLPRWSATAPVVLGERSEPPVGAEAGWFEGPLEPEDWTSPWNQPPPVPPGRLYVTSPERPVAVKSAGVATRQRCPGEAPGAAGARSQADAGSTGSAATSRPACYASELQGESPAVSFTPWRWTARPGSGRGAHLPAVQPIKISPVPSRNLRRTYT
jgi:hypothetical protein